jgi:NADPH:quinone reductase-like Zn-dependent oxidoreductase
MGKGFGRLKSVFKKKKDEASQTKALAQAQSQPIVIDADEKTSTPQSSHEDSGSVIVIHDVANHSQFVRIQHAVPALAPVTIHPHSVVTLPTVNAATPGTVAPSVQGSMVAPSVAQSKAQSAAPSTAAQSSATLKALYAQSQPRKTSPVTEPTLSLFSETNSTTVSISQVNVVTSDDVSEYSGGSAQSLSDETEEQSMEESESAEERVSVDEEEIQREKKNRSHKDKKFKRETRQEVESLAEFSAMDEEAHFPEVEPSPKHRRSQRERHAKLVPSQDSVDLEEQSVELSVEDSLSYCTEEGDFVERHSYDTTESSSFHRNPQVENVKRGNEKSMHKDIMIHAPGNTSALMVRAMYYVPRTREEGDVVIEVEASTVSFRDCLLRRNLGMYKAPFPFIPGCQSVGNITSLGKAAKSEGKLSIGDRVLALHRHGGGNAKYARYDYRNVVPIPSDIDAVDAVILGEVYMTAYQALRMGRKDGTPLTGSNVLITDGFSPVGQAAIQLARTEGANVCVTTTDSRQEAYMETLGVKCLPFSPNKWLPKIKGTMDIVIDNTCFDSYDSSWKALNKGGILICTGMTSLYSLTDYGMGNECGCGAFGDMRDLEAKWARMKAKYMMSQTKFYDLWEQFEREPKIFEVRHLYC